MVNSAKPLEFHGTAFELADRGADQTTAVALSAWRIASLATTAEDHALADLARSAATALDAAALLMREIAQKAASACTPSQKAGA